MEINFSDYHTLFLDRDGTINKRIMDGYVTSWDEFHFLPGVLEAIYRFDTLFNHIIIVTNQQGVGKGIMKIEEVNEIHNQMLLEIKNARGRIDQIYVCPHLAIHDPLCRKPNPGMALQAQQDFPDIDFSTSIMIGDTDTDVAFGNRLGMLTVRVGTKSGNYTEKSDLVLESLYDFSLLL